VQPVKNEKAGNFSFSCAVILLVFGWEDKSMEEFSCPKPLQEKVSDVRLEALLKPRASCRKSLFLTQVQSSFIPL
jgi:hypothetical protein